jgi:hypothetical protein
MEYEVYRQEVADFLSTLTIKFDPFVQYYEKRLAKQQGIRIQSEYENPYYLNMCGMYSLIDTPMYVTTVEDNKEVLFDTNLKNDYPITAALYRIPSEEYHVLCTRYPTQVNLIKSIVYPVSDLKTAVNAPVLTVMAYDAGLLYPTERDSLITAINKFIEYMAERWYVPDFEFENLSPFAFWSLLWSLLPTVCYYQRLKNLRTVNVHPMHVWEYLQSKGFGDYRAVLSHKQSLFLYRNIMYLYQNKGKTSNLEILADNLLDGLYVQLVGKNLYQEVGAKASDCITVPEVISENIQSRNLITETRSDGSVVRSMSEDFSSFESMETMVRRMYQEKLEVDGSNRNIVQTESTLGTSTMNYLPSKFLEFKKYIIDARFLNLLIRFMTQSFCYKYVNGRLGYRFKFVDKDTNVKLDLSIGEAIALINYCHHRSLRHEPVTIPTEISFYDPYKEVKPNIPFYFHFTREPGKYPYISIVELNEMLRDITWSNQVLHYKENFNNLVVNQYLAIMKHWGALSRSADLRYHDCMRKLYEDYFQAIETRPVQLTSHSLYEAWFASSEELTQLTDMLNEASDADFRYMDLFERLLREAIPLDDERLKDYFGAARDDTEYYRVMKELFTNMDSYNITFLDTSRDSLFYVFTNPMCVATVKEEITDCIKLPSLSQQVAWRVFDNVCHGPVNTGPPTVNVDKVEETTYMNIYPGVQTSFVVSDEMRKYFQMGSSLVYVDTDTSRPLDDTTLKLAQL